MGGVKELEIHPPRRDRERLDGEISRSARGHRGVPGRETLVETEASRWAAMGYHEVAPDSASSTVQRKVDDTARSTDSATALAAPTGAGQPLPDHVRSIMERVFDVDFSSVRIHVGHEAAAVGALAYACGTDLYFSPGHYDLSSQRGLSLIGHELAHVVQQAQGRVRPTGHIGGVAVNDSTALEREADDLGARAAHEASIAASPRPVLQRPTLQRSLASGADHVAQRQVAEPSSSEPPLQPRAEKRFQVLARLLEEWRAAGLLDPPARPLDVDAFPSIVPPHEGTIRASDGKVVLAGAAAPALAPRWAPSPGPVPGPVRPNLRLVPESPPPTPEPVRPPLLPPGLFAIAVGVVILLWPTETAPAWMDGMSPITGSSYGSPEEFSWTIRLAPQQVKYLRRLFQQRELGGPMLQAPHADPDGHTTMEPIAPPVPVVDGDKRRDGNHPPIDFYHGTDLGTARSMAAGVPITASGHGEFGAGFYTFHVETAASEAAESYTRNRHAGHSEWGVVDFTVPADVMAEFFTASTIAALLEQKFSRILVFPDKTTPVTVRYPREQNGLELTHTWDEFVKVNARLGRNAVWPYDLIIGPLKGKLRSQKAGVDQWVFGTDGVVVFNVPTVKRRVSLSGAL